MVEVERTLSDDEGLAAMWRVLDAIPDGTLIVDRVGSIVFANEAAQNLFGRSASVGSYVDDLLPQGLRAVHLTERARFFAAPQVRPMGRGRTLLALRSDGTTFPVEVSLNPLDIERTPHVVAVVRDVTKRVEAETYLRRVLATLDASNDGIFIFDADTLRYSYVNEGAVRMVGYPAEELLRMTPAHLNAHSSVEEYHELVKELEVHGPDVPVVRQSRLLCRDGHEVPLEKTFQLGPSDASGRRWVIAFARDITARLDAEAQLEVHRQALIDAEQELAVSDARDEIARSLSETVIRRLFGAGLHLEAARQSGDLTRALRLDAVVEELDVAIREVRAAVFSLQAVSSTHRTGGLRGRLIDLIGELADARGVETSMQFEGEPVPDAVSEIVMSLIREAAVEIVEHAHAKRAAFTLAASTVDVRLIAEHDGSVDPTRDEVLRSSAQRAGVALTVATVPGGTRLTWLLPFGGAHAGASDTV